MTFVGTSASFVPEVLAFYSLHASNKLDDIFLDVIPLHFKRFLRCPWACVSCCAHGPWPRTIPMEVRLSATSVNFWCHENCTVQLVQAQKWVQARHDLNRRAPHVWTSEAIAGISYACLVPYLVKTLAYKGSADAWCTSGCRWGKGRGCRHCPPSACTSKCGQGQEKRVLPINNLAIQVHSGEGSMCISHSSHDFRGYGSVCHYRWRCSNILAYTTGKM